MAHKHEKELILWFDDIGIEDVALVGGKNASLGEMYQYLTSRGVQVPHGFAITAFAYRHLIETSGVQNAVTEALAGLDTHNLRNLQERGKKVREIIRNAPFPADLCAAIVAAYQKMENEYGTNVDVAVRSSATAEDLPDAPSPASRTPTSMSGGRRRSSTIAASVSPACSPTGPSPIATKRDSANSTSTCRLWSRKWSAPTAPAPGSCSPSIPNRDSRTRSISPVRGGSEKMSSRGRSPPTNTTSSNRP